MKKVLTILLVATMLIQSSIAAMAATVSYEAPTNVELSVSTGEIVAGKTFDLTAKINMQSVREKFKDSLELADEYCKGYYSNLTALQKAQAELRLAAIEGSFDLVLTYPSAIVLPESVTKGTKMAGFNEGAKAIFAETKRSVKIGAVNSTLTISIKVKDDLSVGTLERNLTTYLANMTFTAKGLAAKSAADYTLNGALTGTVNCDYSSKSSGMDIDGTINFVEGNGASVAVTVTPATYTVSGTILNYEPGVTATLGGDSVVIDADGKFTVADVANGHYNLVVTDGDARTVTTAVDVTGGDVTNVTVTMPEKKVSTVVEDNSTNGTIIDVLEEIVEAIVDAVENVIKDEVTGDEVNVKDELEDNGSVEINVTVGDVDGDIDTKKNNAKDEVKDKDKYKDKEVEVDSLASVKTEVVVKDSNGDEKAKETKDKVTDDNGNNKSMKMTFAYDSTGKNYFTVVSTDDSGAIINTYTEEDGNLIVDEVNGTVTVITEDATANFLVAYVEETDVETESGNTDEKAPNDDPDTDVNYPTYSGSITGGYYVPDNDNEEKTLDVAVWPFADVNAGDWFYNAVAYTYKNGIFKGTSDTTFDPNAATTRGMIVTLIARIENVSDSAITATPFTDVAENEYYATAIDWAAKNKIVLGYGDGTFGPNDIITREQLAAIWYRYQQYKQAVAEGDTDVELTFADSTQISDYAVDAVKFCYNKGIITGKENNILDPAGSATRAEVATVLTRYLSK